MAPERKEFFPIKLLEKKLVSQDILVATFEKPADFTFLAGQFVQFEIATPDGPALRPYSISSAPGQHYLEFCLKLLPTGKGSVFFKNLAVGHTALVSPPSGAFICRPEHHPAKLFVATGAGLAPIISMIEAFLAESVVTDPIQLLFGVRTPQDVFWVDRLDGLQKIYNHFSYQLSVSRPDSSWSGLSGRVTTHLKPLAVPASNYICGSVEMVKDVRTSLIEQGVNTKNIHFEIF